MDQARPSHTALRVAMRRAAHQLYDARPLVLDDPTAVPILGPYAAELDRTPGLNPALKARPFSIALRAFLVARSRYTEDQLVEQPAIALFEELGWAHVNAMQETMGPAGTLGRSRLRRVP